jgi:2-polyprenyl-3-methyl-5-hydroxy-6-metoxy-1,4-benzoquinol methylase
MIKSKIDDSVTKKDFWERIYQNRSLSESGWYQPIPESSLHLITASKISKKDRIIDVGGGDSLLVDHLLSRGYDDITVLDISEKAIEKAKKRLGALAEKVTWVCSDVTDYQANTTFDLWHDRACLHFLTQESDLKLYKERVVSSISPKGTLILGAFSKTGPEKCSGLPIHQYDSAEMTELFSDEFKSIENFETVHITPSKATQNYVFCRLKKK